MSKKKKTKTAEPKNTATTKKKAVKKTSKEEAPKKKAPRKKAQREFPDLSAKANKLYDKLVALEASYEADKQALLDSLNAEVGTDERTFRTSDGTTVTFVERHGVVFLRKHVAHRKTKSDK